MSLFKLSQFAHTKNKLTKPQRGEVVDNNDPEKRGRVKCKIPGLLEADKAKLPWIYPKNPYGHGGNQKSAGLHVPRMGSLLTIEFPQGMSYHGFYTGYWHHDNNYAMEPFKKNYPNRYGTQDPTQNLTVHDKTDHTVEYFHHAIDDDQSQDSVDTGGDESSSTTGSSSFSAPRFKDTGGSGGSGGSGGGTDSPPKLYLKIDKDGTLTHTSKKDLTSTVEGETSFTATGNVKVKGAKIYLN